VYRHGAETGGPDEMEIDGDEGENKGGHDGSGTAPAADGGGVQRSTDGHVSLDGDGDYQPHRVVARRVQGHHPGTARPLGQRPYVDAKRLQRSTIIIII